MSGGQDGGLGPKDVEGTRVYQEVSTKWGKGTLIEPNIVVTFGSSPKGGAGDESKQRKDGKQKGFQTQMPFIGAVS